MAPPWLAAQQGFVSDGVARITGRGWYDLTDRNFHQGCPRSATRSPPCPRCTPASRCSWRCIGISRLRQRWRWLLLLYPLTMSFMLVYYAEHYVIDILAGFAAVGLVMCGCQVWEAHRAVGRGQRASRTALPPSTTSSWPVT